MNMNKKSFVLVAVCAFSISSLAHVLPENKRVHGENGWYIPHTDVTFKWLDLSEAEKAKWEQFIAGRSLLNPVNFYLYTQENPESEQLILASQKSINASNYNPANPTRIAIHGWTADKSSYVNEGVRKAWLGKGACNFIFVDWGRARTGYLSAGYAVSGVGEQTAALVDFLVENYGLNLQILEIIGHSLGAHVAGFTGKNIKSGKVQKIVGLDPALPTFSYNKPKQRLSDNDAEYVETIHTNGGGLGFLEPIGKAAFYPNGGKMQPGCTHGFFGFFDFFDFFGFLPISVCSHSRAILYYVEAIEKDNFISYKCESYEDAVAKNCQSSTLMPVHMASDVNEFSVAGQFYVPVNSKPPFGKLE